MRTFFFISLLFAFWPASSQVKKGNITKPIIDTGMLGKWPYLDTKPAISSDGGLAAFIIGNQPVNNKTLVIRSTVKSWRKEISATNIKDYFFSQDNKSLIWINDDSISLFCFKSDSSLFIPNVISCRYPFSNKGEWVAYQLKNDSDVFVLNFISREKIKLKDVKDYFFNNTGNALIIRRQIKLDNSISTAIEWVNLPKGNSIVLWRGNDHEIVRNHCFDQFGKQVAFTVQDTTSNVSNTIWYYKVGMEKARLIVSNRSPGLYNKLIVKNERPQFSGNGKWLFFGLAKLPDDRRQDPNFARVDIWSYKDLIINPAQPNPKDVKGVINVMADSVRIIEKEDEQLSIQSIGITGDYAIIRRLNTDVRHKTNSSYWLVSLKNGERTLLKSEGKFPISNISFSPECNWVIYWDCEKKGYICYDIKRHSFSNITKNLPPVSNFNATGVYRFPESDIAGWLKGDSAVLIYDRFDIWKVNLFGKKGLVNISNGYGARKHLKLRLIYENDYLNRKVLYSGNETLLFTGFNTINKYNGFYLKKISEEGDPKLLTSGPFTYYKIGSQRDYAYTFDDGMLPVRATDVDAWIIKRQSATEFPNYFFTTDFKTYVPLTDLEPQQKYNWLTTELVTWKQLDGTISQGVLYKPENLNPRRKYPIIFNYYEKLSHRLYEFPIPSLCDGDIDIPWFVSRGYLVFTPDIYYSIASKGGKTIGEAALNSVVSAAIALSKLPYVNNRKMAIVGHSFGGGETNYILTHSKMFAAACSAASTVSDEISAYLGLLYRRGKPFNFFRLSNAETDHDMIGATLWERPDLYIKASPVFQANKVNTPLLLMHNLGDETTNWEQSVELYMALRRLGKKVWLLQYDDGDHSLSGRDAQDYTIRLTQFFNYYLKDELPPKWMTEGILAYLKGFEMKFELDSSGKTP